MAVNLFGEFLGGIVAHLLLAVIHGGNLQNHGQVPARGNGDGVHGDIDPQNFHILLLQPQAVVDLQGVPGDDFHHKIDFVLAADGTDTEELGHVDNADAPKLNIVTDQLRGGAHQGARGYLPDFHRIIRNQPVTTLEKLHGGLAFADAAVADEKNPLTINLHQNPVPGDPGGQGSLQIGDDGGSQGAGGFRGTEDGDVVLSCHFHALLIRGNVPGNEQGGEFIGEQPVEDHGALRGGQLIQVAHFHIAHDLQTHGFKMVKVSRQLKPGPGHILHRQPDGSIICGSVGYLQMKFLNKGGQQYAVGIDHGKPRLLTFSFLGIL